MDPLLMEDSTEENKSFSVKENEKLVNKSKRKRLNKRKRTRNSKSKEVEDLNKSLVRVNFFEDKKEANLAEEEEIEVVQTKGYKKNLLQDQQLDRDKRAAGGSFCGSHFHKDHFWGAHHDRENVSSSTSPHSEEDYHYCDDSCDDEFYSNYFPRGCPRSGGHREHKCYQKMKYMKMQKEAAHEHSRMSESVDGFVGHKSLDYILDFIGEKSKPGMSKKEKKAMKKQPERKTEKVKKVKNAAKQKPVAEKDQSKADLESVEPLKPMKKKNEPLMKNEGDKENENPPQENSDDNNHDDNGPKSYTSRVFINSKFHSSKEAQKRSTAC